PRRSTLLPYTTLFRSDACGARLIVIFEKAHGASLELQIGFQMQVDIANETVAKTIIKPLVIREIESELLESPFRVAVGFGDPNEDRKSTRLNSSHLVI